MLNKKAFAAVGIVSAVLALAAPAFAVPYDPTSDVTGAAATATSTMAPLVVAVGVGFIGLAVAVWAIRAVLRAIKSGGSRV
jgi:hypothetical protein